MSIKYEDANDIMARLYDITKILGMDHVKLSGIYAIRSYGSGASRTIARCHAMGKIWQKAMGINPVYIIEVINERFSRMSREDQDKVLIHELMHIPLSFGGGFKHHDFVNERNVEKIYQHYVRLKENSSIIIDSGLSNPVNQVENEIHKHEKKKKSWWF